MMVTMTNVNGVNVLLLILTEWLTHSLTLSIHPSMSMLGPRRAIFHSNRAAAYLARSKEEEGNGGLDTDTVGHLEGADLINASPEERKKLNCKAALMDCDQALDLESGNMKARYRKAQALEGLGRLSEATEAAISALNLAPKNMEREVRLFLDKLKVKKEKIGREKVVVVEKELASVKLADPEPKAETETDNLLDSILGGTASESRWPSDEMLHTPGGQEGEMQQQKEKKKGPLIEVISSTEH